MARPHLPKYDTQAHADRVRAVLLKRLDTLPLAALIQLQDVAALLEAGEDLSVLVARGELGPTRGRAQVQRRGIVDYGQRSGAVASVGRRAAEEAERAAVVATVTARRRRFGP